MTLTSVRPNVIRIVVFHDVPREVHISVDECVVAHPPADAVDVRERSRFVVGQHQLLVAVHPGETTLVILTNSLLQYTLERRHWLS